MNINDLKENARHNNIPIMQDAGIEFIKNYIKENINLQKSSKGN